MNILLKVLVITIGSALLVLLLIDYSSFSVQLNLSSKINCLKTSSETDLFLCNTCFIVNLKAKYH